MQFKAVRKTLKIILPALILSVFLSGVLVASDIQFTAQVDKQTVYKDQEVNLSLRVSGAGGMSNIQAPKLPTFEGFDAFYSGRASHFMFVNGRSSSTTEFSYVLVPKATGVFKLDPIEVIVGGQTYHAEPIQIEVLGQQNAAPIQQQPRNRMPMPPMMPGQKQQAQAPMPLSAAQGRPEGADENIFLRVNPNKRVVYSNEQLLLTYSLLTSYDTRYEGFDQEPETSGFWVEEFPMEREIGKQTETINGKRYMRADIRKMALFPTAPGEYVIKPGSTKASVQIQERPSNLLDEFFNDSFFSNAGIFARRVDKILTSQPITVVVKPLPDADKPKSFMGAVGEFRMSSSVDKRSVNQNEPVTLQITLEGNGNIETLVHPSVPDMPDMKIYDADTKSEFFKVEGLVAGKKTYEIIFIPKAVGTLQIPALEFSFFNPAPEKYVTLKTENYSIEVKPSLTPAPALPKGLEGIQNETKKGIDVVGNDIRYIHERLSPPKRYQDILFWLFLLLDGALSVVGISIFVRNHQKEMIPAESALLRTKFAKRKAKKLLSRLRELQKKDDEKSRLLFFEEAEKLMNQYLADKLNVSPHNLTVSFISDELVKRNVPDALIKRIHHFYDMCGLIRYGGKATFDAESPEILAEVEAILSGDFA